MIKAKLQELLSICLDKGVHFEYSAHVNAISIHTQYAEKPEDWIAMYYSLKEWRGTEAEHIAKLDGFIQQVWELD